MALLQILLDRSFVPLGLLRSGGRFGGAGFARLISAHTIYNV